MNAPAMESKMVVLRAGGLACIRITGRAYFAAAPGFKRALATLSASRPDRILLDLDQCQYMDSTFLGVLTHLAEVFRTTSKPPRCVELYNAKPQIVALLTSLGVDSLFEQHAGIPELPADAVALDISAGPASKIELKETSLAAHEELIRLNPANEARFTAITGTLRDDLVRLKAGEPPALPGFDMAVMSRPAGDVSGDFHDFAPRSGLRAAVILADVSGKGAGAAEAAGRCRPLVHAQLAMEQPPGQVLAKALPELMTILPQGMFVTAFCLVLDSARRIVQAARGGHEPLLWFHAATATVEAVEPRGVALCIERAGLCSGTYGSTEFAIASGDILLLYTDGITDGLDAAGHEFGRVRLENALKEASTLDAKAIAENVLAAVKEFAGTAPQADDQTVVVIKAS
jgi:anti-anti-sigma regulatory factor